MPRNHYHTPRPNTKISRIKDLMLREQGVTSKELEFLLGKNYKTRYVNSAINYLTDMCGYDIRSFHLKNCKKLGRKGSIYKIVGRYSWDGEYTSYIDPENIGDNLYEYEARR